MSKCKELEDSLLFVALETLGAVAVEHCLKL